MRNRPLSEYDQPKPSPQCVQCFAHQEHRTASPPVNICSGVGVSDNNEQEEENVQIMAGTVDTTLRTYCTEDAMRFARRPERPAPWNTTAQAQSHPVQVVKVIHTVDDIVHYS